MKPEQVIAEFLREAFTDESLSVLRADAVAGKVPWRDPKFCLVGHAFGLGFIAVYGEASEYGEASDAYQSLTARLRHWYNRLGVPTKPEGDDDYYRMQNLIPLIDRETARRAAERAEVVARAKEVVTQPQLSTLPSPHERVSIQESSTLV